MGYRPPSIATRQVFPGERVRIQPELDAAVRWSVWIRTAPDMPSTLLGGWNFLAEAYAADPNVPAALAAAAGSIAGTEDGPNFSPESLALLETAAAGRRDVQVMWYAEEGHAVAGATLEFGTAGRAGLEESIFHDEEYLVALRKARAEATDTQGIAHVILPDGSQETYRKLADLDRQVVMVEDRLARRKAARSGAYWIGRHLS